MLFDSEIQALHSGHEGTALNYEALSQAVQAVCAGIPLGEDWKERIDQDFEKRKC